MRFFRRQEAQLSTVSIIEGLRGAVFKAVTCAVSKADQAVGQYREAGFICRDGGFGVGNGMDYGSGWDGQGNLG